MGLRKRILQAPVLAALVFGVMGASGRTHAASSILGPINNSWLAGWPMVGHDPQRSNRSPNRGPIDPRLLWTRNHVLPDPVVGSNGVIYGWAERAFVALNASGRPLWRYSAWEGDGGPAAITPGKSVGVLAMPVKVIDPVRASILVISYSGKLAWSVPGVGFSKGASPLATADGNLYIPVVGPELFPNPYGALHIVSVTSGRHSVLLNRRSVGNVAQAPDGDLYALVSNYDKKDATELEAATATGALLWQRPDSSSSLLIGRQRNVYTAGDTVTARDAAGHLLWRRKGVGPVGALAERADGTLLALGMRWLDAFSSKGKHLWRAKVARSTFFSPDLAVDAVGRVYVATDTGTLGVVSRGGRLLAHIRIGPKRAKTSGATVAIGPDGKLIVTGADGNLRVYG